MDVKSEEIFSSEDAPLNRSNFALGVYQNVIYLYGGECNFSGMVLKFKKLLGCQFKPFFSVHLNELLVIRI